ncbi:Os11g0237300 [Oryza sativa Japonica Group]|jgi:hypothetical protein|uniref:Os11g0237300 protein n=1 Tax=Oryza sativa subsp. japonica TaxID=39947 RepID=A0A0P0Y136_ORYSJ|nr:Os11g0237300 [Oryza sativa Japonica Group]
MSIGRLCLPPASGTKLLLLLTVQLVAVMMHCGCAIAAQAAGGGGGAWSRMLRAGVSTPASPMPNSPDPGVIHH